MAKNKNKNTGNTATATAPPHASETNPAAVVVTPETAPVVPADVTNSDVANALNGTPTATESESHEVESNPVAAKPVYLTKEEAEAGKNPNPEKYSLFQGTLVVGETTLTRYIYDTNGNNARGAIARAMGLTITNMETGSSGRGQATVKRLATKVGELDDNARNELLRAMGIDPTTVQKLAAPAK